MKRILILLLAVIPSLSFATEYYSINNNNWSLTPNGSNCGCTPSFNGDILYINHNMTLSSFTPVNSEIYVNSNNITFNGLSSTNSTITVENGGKLNFGWSANIDANSSIDIKDGGELKSSVSFNVYGDLNVEGTLTYNGGGLTIMPGGNFEVLPNGYADIKNITIQNNGNMVVNGFLKLKQGTFQNNASMEINGEVDVSNATFQNQGPLTGVGIITLANNTSFQNNSSINGCTGTCSISTGQSNYLANIGTGANWVIRNNNSWINGSPSSSRDVLFLEDYEISSNMVMKKLEVSTGMTVTIKQNRSITVNDDLINNGDIIIEDKGSLVQTQTSTQNSGNGTYKLYKTGTPSQTVYNKWSTPMPNQSIIEVFQDANLYDLFTFETSSQSWKYDFNTLNPTNNHANSPYSFGNNHMIQNADGIMDIGRSYFAPGKVNPQRVFENNVINNGDYTVNVATTNVTTPGSWGGNDWNLIGNPYPSPINIQDFLNQNYNGGAGNVANAVYFWDGPNAQYVTRNTTDNELMSTAQGFWVAAVNNGSVSFSNSMRGHGSNVTLRSGESNFDPIGAYLNIEQDSLSDYIRVYFDPMAENGLDNLYDARKMQNSNGFNFYSILDDQYMVFQSVTELADEEQKVIPIGFSTGSDSDVTFSIDSLANWPDNYSIYLHDLKNAAKMKLKKNSPITLQLDSAGTYDNRFVLTFTIEEAAVPVDPSTGLTEMNGADKEPLYLTKRNGFELVNTTNKDIEFMTVHTITGRLALEHGKINIGDKARAQLDQNGVYIITTYFTNGQTQNKKLIVH